MGIVNVRTSVMGSKCDSSAESISLGHQARAGRENDESYPTDRTTMGCLSKYSIASSNFRLSVVQRSVVNIAVLRAAMSGAMPSQTICRSMRYAHCSMEFSPGQDEPIMNATSLHFEIARGMIYPA